MSDDIKEELTTFDFRNVHHELSLMRDYSLILLSRYDSDVNFFENNYSKNCRLTMLKQNEMSIDGLKQLMVKIEREMLLAFNSHLMGTSHE